MKSRELRIVASEKPVGSVGVDDEGKPFFKDGAEDTFAGARRRRDDDEALVAELLKDGWSNGYVYLAPRKSRSKPNKEE